MADPGVPEAPETEAENPRPEAVAPLDPDALAAAERGARTALPLGACDCDACLAPMLSAAITAYLSALSPGEPRPEKSKPDFQSQSPNASNVAQDLHLASGGPGEEERLRGDGGSDFEVFTAEDGDPAIRMTDAAELASAKRHIESLRAEIDGYKRDQDDLLAQLRLRGEVIDAARAAFKLIDKFVNYGEMKQAKDLLRNSLAALDAFKEGSEGK